MPDPAGRVSAPGRQPEHFVTLFDVGFLPIGLALYASLQRHAPGAILWVVCMDLAVETALERLALPWLRLLPLRAIEDDALLAAKAGRSRREYCWTITSHTPSAVFRLDASVSRVTYIDADLWFLRNPDLLLEQLQPQHGLLVTEHEYPPHRQDWSQQAGRFCVQFLTVVRQPRALEALTWWQEQVRAWCYDRVEPGRFGDQLYLNRWPELFGDTLSVVEPRGWCLGPWNADHFDPSTMSPVFYHFHNLRFLGGGRIQLSDLYPLGHARSCIYPTYLIDLAASVAMADRVGASGPWVGPYRRAPWLERLRQLKRVYRGLRHEARLPASP